MKPFSKSFFLGDAALSTAVTGLQSVNVMTMSVYTKSSDYLGTWDQDFLSLCIGADCRPDKMAFSDEKFFRSLHSYQT